VKFSTDSEGDARHENITAILAYCLDVDNSEKMDSESKRKSEKTGVTIKIEGEDVDYKFLEEKSTRVILRESLQEIWLYPRNLFFEPKK
jgi:hypothetical protein